MWETIDNSPWTVVGAIIVLLIAWLADRWAEKREQNKNQIMTTKTTVTATFPGIGKVEISRERARQILRLQKIIRERESINQQPVSSNQ